MRKVLLAASLTLAFLAGCSSPPRESGYEVRMVRATERQEPWQNRAIHLAPFSPAGVAVVYVKLPQPLPEKWKREFVDSARTYLVPDGPRKAKKPLVREVFRAVVFMGAGETRTYDAVVDREVRGFTVFVPLSEAESIRGQSLLILSSDSRWGMTVQGTLVEFEKGFAPDRLPAGFFAAHPSTVAQVIRLDPVENEHARLALDSVVRCFPLRFSLRGKDGDYLGKPDVVAVLSEFTSLEGTTDRLISCTSLKLGPGSVAVAPIVGAFYGLQAVRALTKEDCLK